MMTYLSRLPLAQALSILLLFFNVIDGTCDILKGKLISSMEMMKLKFSSHCFSWLKTVFTLNLK